jgi:hypothetical protein
MSFSNALKNPATRQSGRKPVATRPPSTTALSAAPPSPAPRQSSRMEIETPPNSRPKRSGANTDGKTQDVQINLAGLRQQVQVSMTRQNKKLILSDNNN